jgi:hypothetical protein
MAIKVNGTTVIDDSRVLSNVTGLKTINSTSILGSGNISAGSSTTYNAVGTYCMVSATVDLNPNSTRAGSGLNPSNLSVYNTSNFGIYTNGSLSGTWRIMGNGAYSILPSALKVMLAVRIS